MTGGFGAHPSVPSPRVALYPVIYADVRDSDDSYNNLTKVTYGGMSKQPVMVPTGLLIFNDVRCSGFWMTRWCVHDISLSLGNRIGIS